MTSAQDENWRSDCLRKLSEVYNEIRCLASGDPEATAEIMKNKAGIVQAIAVYVAADLTAFLKESN